MSADTVSTHAPAFPPAMRQRAASLCCSAVRETPSALYSTSCLDRTAGTSSPRKADMFFAMASAEVSSGQTTATGRAALIRRAAASWARCMGARPDTRAGKAPSSAMRGRGSISGISKIDSVSVSIIMPLVDIHVILTQSRADGKGFWPGAGLF